uniref:Major facilitator superfamily (MFS) profile domain-containing protein n=1 Tax=Acrobeloides nanus TaxID=290746 RepID=A0A914EJ77_9BILA
MRTNIGISMVCMVNSTAYTSKAYDNGTAIITKPKNPACQRGTFLWNPEMQGVLISSTAYGSIITILFAGYIADSYGPRLVCLIALILYAIVTLLSPFLASLNYVVFLIARSIMGLAEGCVWPCAAALIVKWFPKTERSTVAAIYTSGNQLGASVGSFVSAKLCLLTFLGGWPLIFYIYGILGIACIILCIRDLNRSIVIPFLCCLNDRYCVCQKHLEKEIIRVTLA